MLGRCADSIRIGLLPALALVALRCTSFEVSEKSSGPCVGPNCVPLEAGSGNTADVVNPDAGAPSGSAAIDPACGAIACLPDDAKACQFYDAAVTLSPDAPSDASVEPKGPEASVEAAGSDASLGLADAETGAMDVAVAADSGGGTVLGHDASEASSGGEPIFGCHVVRQGALPVSQCALGGGASKGAPCAASSDCAPGLACVGAENVGSCVPYCCSGEDACDKGRFCAKRPLREGLGNSTPLEVPVCVVAENCSLEEPFSCSGGTGCACPVTQACTVVRSDGTTGCVEPGSGAAGEACPCAVGFFCSRATNTCLRLCNTAASTDECGAGECQAISNFPEGMGVCVGATAENARAGGK